MKLLSIAAPMEALGEVADICGKSGIFQPEDAMSFHSDVKHFTPVFEENPYKPVLKNLEDIYRAGGKNFNSEAPESKESFEIQRDYVNEVAEHIQDLETKNKEINKKLDEAIKLADQISHFVGLNLNLNEIFECTFTSFRFGKLPKESYQKLKTSENSAHFTDFQCTSDAEYYWGLYAAPNEYAPEMDRILSGLYFERIRIAATDLTPEQKYESLQNDIESLKKQSESSENEIKEYIESQYQHLESVYSSILSCSSCFDIRRYAARYNDTFTLVGWVLSGKEDSLISELKNIPDLEYSLDNPEIDKKHSPPVKLKNNRLFKPFEMFVDMYGLPSYGEFDPTPFVALTYILLFGIMFADLGQGLALILIGYLMYKLKNMGLGPILMRCGISSALFGLVFGSVFGFENLLNPMYKLLFNLDEKPIDVMAPATTNMIIYTAVGIGIVLVVMAMILNVCSCLSKKRIGNALFGANGVAGIVLYVSAVAGLVCQILLKIPVMTPVYVLCLIILPLILIFLCEPLSKLIAGRKDWAPESWGEYIMQNFFELFETALSYVTNTMSFLRVGAFVLVHAGMMMVVFTLAEMSGGVGYTVIVIIGNIIVTALEGLLVGIQVLRLEFYEMFSRFFDGGGKRFSPINVKANTAEGKNK